MASGDCEQRLSGFIYREKLMGMACDTVLRIGDFSCYLLCYLE